MSSKPKRFLLQIGYKCYPVRGDCDWHACYDTEQEANDALKAQAHLFGRFSDMWSEIVDLYPWIYPKEEKTPNE